MVQVLDHGCCPGPVLEGGTGSLAIPQPDMSAHSQVGLRVGSEQVVQQPLDMNMKKESCKPPGWTVKK